MQSFKIEHAAIEISVNIITIETQLIFKGNYTVGFNKVRILGGAVAIKTRELA